MSGRGPRWFTGIKYPKWTVAISGDLRSKYGTATIGGTEYTAATTVDAKRGETASVFVSAGSSSNRPKCRVTLNGETVQSGDGTYTFPITGDTTIVFTHNSSYNYWSCAITMG